MKTLQIRPLEDDSKLDAQRLNHEGERRLDPRQIQEDDQILSKECSSVNPPPTEHFAVT